MRKVRQTKSRMGKGFMDEIQKTFPYRCNMKWGWPGIIHPILKRLACIELWNGIAFRFLILRQAGRIAWDHGKKVLNFIYNKVTKQSSTDKLLAASKNQKSGLTFCPIRVMDE